MRRVVLFVMTVMLMAACTYAVSGRNLTFTSSNVMKLKVGMTTNEVTTIFGAPDRMRSTTCGSRTTSGSWSCLVWEYDVEKSSDGFVEETKTNTLTFNNEYSPPRLNHWDIKRMW